MTSQLLDMPKIKIRPEIASKSTKIGKHVHADHRPARLMMRGKVRLTRSTSAPPPSAPEEVSYTLEREEPRSAVRVFGEPFYLIHEDDTYFLRHKYWSLVGAGDSPSEAIKDLIAEARDAAPVYRRLDPSEFDKDGYDLYQFLLRIA